MKNYALDVDLKYLEAQIDILRKQFDDLEFRVDTKLHDVLNLELSKEEKAFKVSYRPYTIMSSGLVEGDIQVKFVRAKDIVDAQDQLLNTCNCTIENIEEVK